MKYPFETLGAQLAELIPDLEVREAKSNIAIAPSRNPFDNHLYLTVLVKDGVPPEFSLAAQALSKVLNQFKIVETQALQLPDAFLGASSEIVQVGSLPVRFSAVYDSLHQGIRITADLLVRHVGNYYRTIINGPMHRLEMPFKDNPSDSLVFDHYYMPLERPDYYQDVTDGADYIDSVMLPDLDPAELYPEHLHSYRVKGNYCYYTGEELT